mmetsp:Transcript_27506/g.66764  ORF Transcript_27506/g.66764 Transcript_27506/m.66764 type:complete len:458 (+) Transcript_27506:502-1875(+)
MSPSEDVSFHLRGRLRLWLAMLPADRVTFVLAPWARTGPGRGSQSTLKCSCSGPGDDRARTFARRLATVGGAVALGLSIALTNVGERPLDVASAFSPEQKLVAEAWRIVDQSFVDRTFNNQDWFKIRMKAVKHQYDGMDDAYEGIRQMLAKLDDVYTRFLSPDQYSSLTSSATGEVVGVGVELFPARVDGNVVVMNPVDDSPAMKAGVRANDVISEIDGEDLDGLSPDEVAARIRGAPGTTVFITLKRQTEESQVEIRREYLKLKTVKAVMKPDGIGYIKLKQFNSSTPSDVKEAIESLKAKQASKFVLDLRDNPGGYFPAGVDVASYFLKTGSPIVYVVNNKGIPDEYTANKDGLVADEPLVVLVNKGTASASEILAGAMKDNHRAQLIGQKTFGKGVVQTLTELSNGSGVAVTVARYETPGHNDINKKGISPDIEVDCPADKEPISCLPQEAFKQ